MKPFKSELFEALKELDKALAFLFRQLSHLVKVRTPNLSGNLVWEREHRKDFAVKWLLHFGLMSIVMLLAGLNVLAFVAWMQWLVTGMNSFLLLLVIAGVQTLLVSAFLAFFGWVGWELIKHKKAEKQRD